MYLVVQSMSPFERAGRSGRACRNIPACTFRETPQFQFCKEVPRKRMHCRSQNAADTAIFTQEPSPPSSKRDAFLAAILAQNMKTYAVAAGSKRSCPFAAPAKRQRVCRLDDDIQALQQDVEDLEARLAAAQRWKNLKAKCPRVNGNGLQSMLQTCLKQAQRESTPGSVDVPRYTQLEYEPRVDAPVYRLMETRVADQFDDLTRVFRDAGLGDIKADLCNASVITGGHQGTFVRFTKARVAPFPLDAVSGAIWNGVKKSSVLNMGAADPAIKGGDDSVIYVKRECLLQNDASCAAGIPVLLRGVCRRLVEPHRVVLVWEGTGDWPKDYLRSHPSSVPIRERGYCVVQDFYRDNSKSGRAAPLSLIQTCVCMTPGLSADIDMNEPECLEMLSNVVIPSYRKLLDAREQMLENSILDEMIHSKMRGFTARI